MLGVSKIEKEILLSLFNEEGKIDKLENINNEKLVLKAIKENDLSLNDLSDELAKDKKFILPYIKKGRSVKISDIKVFDDDIIFELLKQQPNLIHSEELPEISDTLLNRILAENDIILRLLKNPKPEQIITAISGGNFTVSKILSILLTFDNITQRVYDKAIECIRVKYEDMFSDQPDEVKIAIDVIEKYITFDKIKNKEFLKSVKFVIGETISESDSINDILNMLYRYTTVNRISTFNSLEYKNNESHFINFLIVNIILDNRYISDTMLMKPELDNIKEDLIIFKRSLSNYYTSLSPSEEYKLDSEFESTSRLKTLYNLSKMSEEEINTKILKDFKTMNSSSIVKNIKYKSSWILLLDKDPSLAYYMPEELYDKEIILSLLFKNPKLIKKLDTGCVMSLVDEDFVTQLLSSEKKFKLKWIEYYIKNFSEIRKIFKSEDIQRLAVNNHVSNLKFILSNKSAFIIDLIKSNTKKDAIKYLKKGMQTQEICAAAFNIDPDNIKYFKEKYKKPYMYIDGIIEKGYKYISNIPFEKQTRLIVEEFASNILACAAAHSEDNEFPDKYLKELDKYRIYINPKFEILVKDFIVTIKEKN